MKRTPFAIRILIGFLIAVTAAKLVDDCFGIEITARVLAAAFGVAIGWILHLKDIP